MAKPERKCTEPELAYAKLIGAEARSAGKTIDINPYDKNDPCHVEYVTGYITVDIAIRTAVTELQRAWLGK